MLTMNRLIPGLAALAPSAIGLSGCSTPPAAPPASGSSSTAPALRQTVVPFTALVNPQSVAIDNAGDVEVVDRNHDRVVELAAG
jgi:serine/threonine protein kinase, bacterial